MKRINRKGIIIAICFIGAFLLWTMLVCFVDVKAIGPRGSEVGFATVNGFVHNIFGVHMWLYTVTDWLGLVPIGVCLCFAVLGLAQWIKRKSISKVDFSLLVLGVYYMVTIAVYVLFEYVVINHRPVIIDGYLEASYPSSTTMLVLSVMPTLYMQLKERISNRKALFVLGIVIYGFVTFMVGGRLVSGVHWFSDIVGGAFVSIGLVLTYYSLISKKLS